MNSRILILGAALVLVAQVALGADCKQALFAKPHGVFANEGGYQNSKHDTGNFINGNLAGENCGGTNIGIACGPNIEWVRKNHVDIRSITQDQAADFYSRGQCAQLRFTELEGQKIPTKMLDLAVNMGTGTAIKLIVRTVNRLNGAATDLAVKPVMTDEILDWYNIYTADPDQRSIFYLTLILEALDRYSDIVEANPKQAQWLLGWIIRLNPLSD